MHELGTPEKFSRRRRRRRFRVGRPRQRRLAMQALRHNLAIALHRNALAGVAEGFEQRSHRQRSGKIAAFAIDDEVHGVWNKQQT
jgi:hypothetical protein